jgi:dihydropyrimidinase
MADYDLIVLNGLVVTHQETGEYDIAIKDGMISKVVPKGGLSDKSAKKTIDAQGAMVMYEISAL